MGKILSASFATLLLFTSLYAGGDTSHQKRKTVQKSVKKPKKAKLSKKELEKQIQEQMKREEKYARERKFYTAKDYNFSAVKVDPKTVGSVPLIEPDYDFDITDVYRDDQ
jgi:hypothetical protein